MKFINKIKSLFSSKNIFSCPKCGSKLGVRVTFCENCVKKINFGERLEKKEKKYAKRFMKNNYLCPMCQNRKINNNPSRNLINIHCSKCGYYKEAIK